MKTGIFTVLVAAAALTGAAALTSEPAAAHHSFAAEFDENTKIELTGVVTKVDWRNPHTYFFIDVMDEDGNVENWGLELGSPNGLMRRGWTRTSLKVGDTVTVNGYRARDMSYKGNARTVTLADGKLMFANSSADSERSAGGIYFQKKDEKAD